MNKLEMALKVFKGKIVTKEDRAEEEYSVQKEDEHWEAVERREVESESRGY